jgi:hypothetical protein
MGDRELRALEGIQAALTMPFLQSARGRIVGPDGADLKPEERLKALDDIDAQIGQAERQLGIPRSSRSGS